MTKLGKYAIISVLAGEGRLWRSCGDDPAVSTSFLVVPTLIRAVSAVFAHHFRSPAVSVSRLGGPPGVFMPARPWTTSCLSVCLLGAVPPSHPCPPRLPGGCGGGSLASRCLDGPQPIVPSALPIAYAGACFLPQTPSDADLLGLLPGQQQTDPGLLRSPSRQVEPPLSEAVFLRPCLRGLAQPPSRAP